MAKVFLTGFKANDSTKLHLYLPNKKQPVDLPSNGLARSHEEKRRSHISEDKADINKLISRSVHHGRFWSQHMSSIDNTGVLNSILGRHPFPLCQGPIVIPLDNNAMQVGIVTGKNNYVRQKFLKVEQFLTTPTLKAVLNGFQL